MPVHHGTSTRSHGPLIEVRLDVTRPNRARLARVGQASPAAVRVSALLDTGAESSCIDPTVIARLGIQPVRYIMSNMPLMSGLQPTREYQVELVIEHPAATTGQFLHIPDLDMLERDLSGAGAEAILGRDVLAQCVFTYDGLTDSFTLSH